MKKYLLLALSVLLVITGCTKKEKFDPAKAFQMYGSFKEFVSDLADGIPYQPEWRIGDEVGILLINGKAISTKADSVAPAYRFIAEQESATSYLKYTDYAFIADATIPTHQYYGFYPYKENITNPTLLSFSVAENQTQSAANSKGHIKENSVFYGNTSVSSPADAANVNITLNPALAILKIPVITGENLANRITLTASEGAPALTATAATLNMTNGAIDVTSGSDKVIVSISTPIPASADIQYIYASILPGNHTGKPLAAELVTDASTRTMDFEGADFKAGTIYTLIEIPKGADGYEVSVNDVAFDQSYIYDVKDNEGNIIGAVAKEYLGKTTNQQVIAVYGVNKNGAINMNNALVAKVVKAAAAEEYMNYSDVASTEKVHGGFYNFTDEAYTTPGESEALSKVYIIMNEDSTTTASIEEPLGDKLTPSVSAQTLTLSDRGDSYPYKLVKIGKRIIMAENLITTKLPDGTDIVRANNADEFKTYSAANTETGCRPCYMVFNEIPYYNGYCAGQFPATEEGMTDKNTMENVIAPEGWSVMTAGGSTSDFVALSKYAATSSNFDLNGNNITLFSSVYIGRVSNGNFSPTTAGTIYWSSTLNIYKSAPKVRGYFCKITENNSAAAIGAVSPTTLYNGFAIRLIKK